MNADTNDYEAVESPGDRLHRLLCATILGEASAEERAEVERALATSPELGEERARLEATIGLFQGALTDGERLSPTAARELEAALARRRPRAWHARPAFRIAASVLAVGSLGWLGWRALDALRGDRRDANFAMRPESAGADEVAKLDRSVEDQRGLGYSGVAVRSAERRKDAAEPKNQPDQLASATAQPSASTGYGFEAERAETQPAFGEKLEAAHAIASVAESDGIEARRLETAGIPTSTKESDLADLGLLATREQLAGRAVTDAGSGSDTFFARTAAQGERLARPNTAAGSEPAAQGGAGGAPAGPASPGPTGVAYRGPGDSAPPAEKSQDDARRRVAGDKRLKKLDDPELLRGLGYLDHPADGDEQARDRARVELGEAERGGQIALSGNEFVVVPDPRAIEARIDAILARCRRLPDERPRDMFFRFWGDNGYEYPSVDRLSTFSVDVDTASYALARNYLVSGYLPEKHAVRTEEFLNYFKGDVRPPESGTFAIETEVAPALFGETRDSLMLRVAIRGKEVSKSERTPVALTFVIDVSGSMREGNRLELVKNALRLLVTQLDAHDSVSIVTFSNDAELVLPMTSAKHRLAIERALQPLAPRQGTNTEAGLRLGYEQAFAHRDPNVQNRVVLLTDGVANVGITDPATMTERVSAQRRAGIYLNTIGVGMNNHNDALLEQLADKGDGLCNYVDDEAEARRALVDNFTGAFQPIARDVKVQVEFDPTQVARYRLLGYENRAIADRDFRNDRVDAGEVGAGHQVVALYELVPASGLGDGPLATVRLRWKDPHGEGASERAHESAHPVTAKSVAGSYAQTSAGYRRSVLVAQFAELLRRSVHADGDSFDRLLDESRALAAELRDPEVDELVALIVKSRDLIVARLAEVDPCDARLDELRRLECKRAEAELLHHADDELLARRDALERELRDCLRERVRSVSLEEALRGLGYVEDR